MKKTITVGGTLRDAAGRLANSWERAERGEALEPQEHVTFVSWSALASAMTDKRFELLRHLREHPAATIRGLARELGRDFKRVHEDLTALSQIGLVEHGADGQWRVDWDEIHTAIKLHSAA
jgi:predicted transcriptional regulator